jgi:hypothetical protein
MSLDELRSIASELGISTTNQSELDLVYEILDRSAEVSAADNAASAKTASRKRTRIKTVDRVYTANQSKAKKVDNTMTKSVDDSLFGSLSDEEQSMMIETQEKEKAAEYTGDFNFQISEITRYMPGPLDQELLDNVFPAGTVTTAEEFAAKIKEQIVNQFVKDADYKFLLDMRKYVTEKVGKLEFPDEKLKRIMLANAKDEKKVEENYDKSLEELTWHLIKEQLIAQTGVKVEDGDVLEMAKEVTRMQFAQYGMLNIPEEYIDNSVKEMLKKRETVDNLIDRAIEVKLGTALKEMVTLKEKSVTAEEFNKMF